MKNTIYNNIINNTLERDKAAQGNDSLETARAVFNNMGVALPAGDITEVSETLKTNDYMGWRACTAEEAQAAADAGVAAMGVSEDGIVIIAANDEDEPVAATASIMTLSNDATVSPASEMEYYAYSYATTPSFPTDPNADANPERTADFDALVGTKLTDLDDSYFNGQCINYAFLRMREVWGLSNPPASAGRYSGPLHWIDNANTEYYYTHKVNKGQVYDYENLTNKYCAVFDTGTDTGHMIFIEYIQRTVGGEILNIYFTEANWGGIKGQWDSSDGILKKMSFNDFKTSRTGLRGKGVQTR